MIDIANGLIPARELAARDASRVPNESPEYRRARTSLLAEEIELRRNIERVAAMRRALPPGAPIEKDYVFESENGAVHFADLFGRHSTLIVYNYMFGPERQRPCPMCTALLGGIAGNASDIQQRAALAVVARSPIEKLLDFKRERGWWHLPALQRHGRGVRPGFRGLDEGRRPSGLQRILQAGRYTPPFLGW